MKVCICRSIYTYIVTATSLQRISFPWFAISTHGSACGTANHIYSCKLNCMCDKWISCLFRWPCSNAPPMASQTWFRATWFVTDIIQVHCRLLPKDSCKAILHKFTVMRSHMTSKPSCEQADPTRNVTTIQTYLHTYKRTYVHIRTCTYKYILTYIRLYIYVFTQPLRQG